jgi:hypothetical protein
MSNLLDFQTARVYRPRQRKTRKRLRNPINNIAKHAINQPYVYGVGHCVYVPLVVLCHYVKCANRGDNSSTTKRHVSRSHRMICAFTTRVTQRAINATSIRHNAALSSADEPIRRNGTIKTGQSRRHFHRRQSKVARRGTVKAGKLVPLICEPEA